MGPLLAGLAPMLGSMLAGGGLQKLLGAFKDKGMEEKANSWISTGQNQQLSREEFENVVGRDEVRDFARRLGVTEGEAASALAALIPEIVDKASPDGRLMDDQSLDAAFRRLQAAGA
jgi:uncharacterized protein YidB (DUF937 family)